ncbi:hypothetical protein [Solidesulfovibrio sp.]|jgi:uncharacterized C2H2 Zn-finger protein|uniref:hypothetical protein n=1 Tax=Solidesulfovibrio sp. TaxID=2910990 RepID=UPI000EDE72E7|nr:hypothetical protein [Solidesulfovibrio sp.]MEA5090138.1 hypothetical protein [Solidesulfovibrio sp.]HCR13018.1 hypothetical protein [Desulfovibrio sp.]HML60867.1 hypothetical protein [Solidesulfovibrio sp.]
MTAETVFRCPACGVVFNAADLEGKVHCPVCDLPFGANHSHEHARGPLRGIFTAQAFVDPASGRVVRFEYAWLWTLLFGPLYFAWRGAWLHAAICLAAAVATVGLSWLVYPFLAARLLRRHYLCRGFDPV